VGNRSHFTGCPLVHSQPRMHLPDIIAEQLADIIAER